MRKALMIGAAFFAISGMGGGLASAEDNPLANRPQDPPPIVQYFISQGLKVTAIGRDGGVIGYLLEKSDGKMQTVYVTPDGKHVVAGLLVGTGGMNVTALQLDAMKQRFDDAKRQVGPVSGVVSPLSSAVTSPDGSLPTPVAPSNTSPSVPAAKADAPKPHADNTLQPPAASAGSVADASIPPLLPVPIQTSGTPPVLTPAEVAADISRSAQWASKVDKAAFMEKVRATAFFTVGAPRAAGVPPPPELFMVADPQCPFCHHAWQTLRPLIIAGKLTVNLILINGLNGSEPLSLSILSRKEPGKAWFAGEGSEDGHPILPPPAASSQEYRNARTFLDLNNRFASDMKIHGTPFFAYVSHVNNKLYLAEGPRNLEDFLAAL